jgi:hypothetical protein
MLDKQAFSRIYRMNFSGQDNNYDRDLCQETVTVSGRMDTYDPEIPTDQPVLVDSSHSYE